MSLDAELATTNDEMLREPGPLPLEETSGGKSQNGQEGREATLISEENGSGQTGEPNTNSEFLSLSKLKVVEFDSYRLSLVLLF